MLNVLQVSKEVAGDFYVRTKARNLGGTASHYEVLFFCDADAYADANFIDRIRNDFEGRANPELIIASHDLYEESKTQQLGNSSIYELDGQFFIRNHLFHQLRGFNEAFLGWGAEAYDLFIRANILGATIQEYGYPRGSTSGGIRVLGHTDDLRDQYLSKKLHEFKRKRDDGTYAYGKNVAWNQSVKMLQKMRRHFRSRPGKPAFFDPVTAHRNHVRLLTARGERSMAAVDW